MTICHHKRPVLRSIEEVPHTVELYQNFPATEVASAVIKMQNDRFKDRTRIGTLLSY